MIPDMTFEKYVFSNFVVSSFILKKSFVENLLLFNLSLKIKVMTLVKTSESTLNCQWGNLLLQPIPSYLNYAAWVDLKRSFGHWQALEAQFRCLMDRPSVIWEAKGILNICRGQLDLTQHFWGMLPPLDHSLWAPAYQMALKSEPSALRDLQTNA